MDNCTKEHEAMTRPIKHREAMELRKAVEQAIADGIPYEVIEQTYNRRMNRAREAMSKHGRYNF